ncbi:hypothetical protein [Stenotrophomonas sp. CFBP8994]|uniref:hypothetical protein n=1 Tax=Stenotrophomonas sp. CFBP8994 TaxID=3096527 RepID=UPI002A6AF994|nr:hypothetical protein [Stenotrophomonas sp. CFBP8994]MDY0978959.1 hypothetical protein [Stenotrophomonas sp. CFBP8994]
MSRLRVEPAELQRTQRLAHLCELNLASATDCRAKRLHGAAFCCESLASDYSREAFELSAKAHPRADA